MSASICHISVAVLQHNCNKVYNICIKVADILQICRLSVNISAKYLHKNCRYVNIEGGKGYFREPGMVNICSREMLDFSVVKCDLFYSREA